MVLQLGAIQALKASGSVESPVELKVDTCQRLESGKIKLRVSDGSKENLAAVLTSNVAATLGELKPASLIRVQEGNVTQAADGHLLIVAQAELLEAGPDAPAEPKPEDAAGASKAAEEPAGASKAAQNAQTPALKKGPGALKSPYNTPANHPTPPSAGWAAKAGASASSAGKRPLQPISALNPYNNNWAIKAKVVDKGPKRAFSRGSVFSAEIVDEAGTAIEATFWRDTAEQAYDLLEEGKVYIFGRGNVKPADKRYSRTRNDYALHFDTASELESCADDIDTSKMQTKLDFVAIDQLPAYVDKKMMVDLLGVVTDVKPLGSVKRKADQVELSRRDLTIVDQSLKTVVVTLWGANAEGAGRELEEQAEHMPVMAISSCRVSSYNGVSVGSLTRSSVLINPDLPEAAALREWWASTGCTAATSHVGEGLASALKPGGSGGAQERATLESFCAAAPPTTEDKPHYASVSATFAMINPDQTMYYMANPENNRKVVEQGPGQYFCEYDGTTLATMVRRYIFSAKVMDASGEVAVQVFNDQAEQLLGMKADELAEIRDSDNQRYQAVLKAALWKDSVLRLKAQAQEYQGEIRQRYSVADVKPIDYAWESRQILARIRAA